MEKVYPCSVCESPNQLYRIGGFDICKICGWEDDGSQRLYPDLDGTNPMSINEAKQLWDKSKTIFEGYPHPNQQKAE